MGNHVARKGLCMVRSRIRICICTSLVKHISVTHLQDISFSAFGESTPDCALTISSSGQLRLAGVRKYHNVELKGVYYQALPPRAKLKAFHRSKAQGIQYQIRLVLTS